MVYPLFTNSCLRRLSSISNSSNAKQTETQSALCIYVDYRLARHFVYMWVGIHSGHSWSDPRFEFFFLHICCKHGLQSIASKRASRNESTPSLSGCLFHICKVDNRIFLNLSDKSKQMAYILIMNLAYYVAVANSCFWRILLSTNTMQKFADKGSSWTPLKFRTYKYIQLPICLGHNSDERRIWRARSQ